MSYRTLMVPDGVMLDFSGDSIDLIEFCDIFASETINHLMLFPRKPALTLIYI